MRSKMKNTPEPWHYSDCIISTEDKLGTDEYVAKAETIADARRIVACVNACKHYTTEDLEDVGENLSGVFADTRQRCAELIAQRDELLAALKELERRAGYMAHCCGFFKDDVAELVASRAAIAKFEVQS